MISKMSHSLDNAMEVSLSTHIGLKTLQFLTKFRIPHPGRVGGRVFIDKAMPLMLSWVLGGNR